MITATSPSKFSSSVAAASLMFCLGGIGAAVAEPTPDTENGRYTLSPVADGVIRLDTRTGAVSTCSNNGNGWACYAVPDERAALDAEIGRLQAENEKLKAQLAAREPTVIGQDRRAAAEIGLAEKAGAEGRRRRAQDRNSAAERPGHGSHDVVSGAGLAAAGRHGQPDAEGRQRQDLSGLCRDDVQEIIDDLTQIALPLAAIGRHRQHHRVVAADGADLRRAALSISPPRSRNLHARRARKRAR